MEREFHAASFCGGDSENLQMRLRNSANADLRIWENEIWVTGRVGEGADATEFEISAPAQLRISWSSGGGIGSGRCPLSDVRCPENRPTSVDALYDDSSDTRQRTAVGTGRASRPRAGAAPRPLSDVQPWPLSVVRCPLSRKSPGQRRCALRRFIGHRTPDTRQRPRRGASGTGRRARRHPVYLSSYTDYR